MDSLGIVSNDFRRGHVIEQMNLDQLEYVVAVEELLLDNLGSSCCIVHIDLDGMLFTPDLETNFVPHEKSFPDMGRAGKSTPVHRYG
jgi:hypothetical protein